MEDCGICSKIERSGYRPENCRHQAVFHDFCLEEWREQYSVNVQGLTLAQQVATGDELVVVETNFNHVLCPLCRTASWNIVPAGEQINFFFFGSLSITL